MNAQPSPRTLALYQGYVGVAKEAKERAQREKELQEIKAKKKADARIRYLAQQKKELNAFTMGESPSLAGLTPDVPELSDPEQHVDHHGQQVQFAEDDPMRVRGSFYLVKSGGFGNM